MSKLTIEEVDRELAAMLEPSAVIDKATKQPLAKEGILKRLLKLTQMRKP